MQKVEMYRLIAEEGKVLTNGTINAPCVDVLKEKADEWTEIDKPEEDAEDTAEVVIE